MTQLNPLTAEVDIGGIWHTTIFIGLAAISCAWVNMARMRYGIGWAFAMLWAYALVSALWLFEYPGLPFAPFNTAFQATAGQTFAEILVIPMGVLSIRNTRRFRLIFSYATAAVMLLQIATVWAGWNGLLIATSFNLAFLAMMMPLASSWIQVLAAATILTHHGSTALAIMAAQAVGYAIHDRRWRWALAAAIPVLFVIALQHQDGPTLLDSGDRLQKWAKHIAFWRQTPWFEVFGVGAGTYMWISMSLDNFKPDPLFFLVMHSDWLQILFAYGWVGLGLATIGYGRLLRANWSRGFNLSVLLGIGAFMATYSPLEWFPTAFWVALALRAMLPGDDIWAQREKYARHYL